MRILLIAPLLFSILFTNAQNIDARFLIGKSSGTNFKSSKLSLSADLTKDIGSTSFFLQAAYSNNKLIGHDQIYLEGHANEYSIGLGYYFSDILKYRWRILPRSPKYWTYISLSPSFVKYIEAEFIAIQPPPVHNKFGLPLKLGIQYQIIPKLTFSLEYKRTFVFESYAMLNNKTYYQSANFGLSFLFGRSGRTQPGHHTRSAYKASINRRGQSRVGHIICASKLWGSNSISNNEPVIRNMEDYDIIKENTFTKTEDEPMSTFSIDVDNASYSNVRRFINQNRLPPKDAVRIEEMVNYFDYDYPPPTDSIPFAIHTESAICPWDSTHQLVKIGIKGKEISKSRTPKSNLAFLIDVSGSMGYGNKLPLVKKSLKLMVDQLTENDMITIVVYAGAAGLVLEPTNGNDKRKIKNAIDKLEAGGSTAGGEGIVLAYKKLGEHFIENGNNRVILCTDGDFNIGPNSDADMQRLIESKRKEKIYITVAGFGVGNYKDSKMEKIADNGNGNYFYIDGEKEATKVFKTDLLSNFYTIAKDVKIQVDFNPKKVQAYRLIGYENRKLENKDFNDDKKDAGELGPGHTVTAFYELIPRKEDISEVESVDDSRYVKSKLKLNAFSNELMQLKLRYKKPDENTSNLITQIIKYDKKNIASCSQDLKFSTSVIEFGMILRDSEFKGISTYDGILKLAKSSTGSDENGYRKEFIELVQKASKIKATDEDENQE